MLEGVVLTLTQLNHNIIGAQELFELARDENEDETLIALEQDIKAYGTIIADLELNGSV